MPIFVHWRASSNRLGLKTGFFCREGKHVQAGFVTVCNKHLLRARHLFVMQVVWSAKSGACFVLPNSWDCVCDCLEFKSLEIDSVSKTKLTFNAVFRWWWNFGEVTLTTPGATQPSTSRWRVKVDGRFTAKSQVSGAMKQVRQDSLGGFGEQKNH